MKREIITTEDGSKTLFISDLNENYHSTHGALQEAQHVFIENGLNLLNHCEINILELGFGTGLNLLVTINELMKNALHRKIHYYTIEKYPVLDEEIKFLNYSSLFESPELTDIYHKAHASNWNETVELMPNFLFTKYKKDFHDIVDLDLKPINLVYYDCFGAKVQPDLWEFPLFEMVTQKMSETSLLTTYSSKGSVRRILKELGLEVEKVPGPPGKREMINAWKRNL